MSFQELYGRAVNSSNLRDSDRHYTCEPLAASGWASRDISSMGACLLRIMYADGTANKIFESGCRNFGDALRVWLPMVREKGRSRHWCPEHDERGQMRAEALYRRVAESSLAYCIDSRCLPCEGTGVDSDRRTCLHCKGTGIAELLMQQREKEITLDLISDLQSLMLSHSSRAAAAMRDVDMDAAIANARQSRVGRHDVVAKITIDKTKFIE